MNEVYFVERKRGNTVVSIMFNKVDNKYHFVNLRSNHICICGFNSVIDAINDMRRLKETGDIIDYYKID